MYVESYILYKMKTFVVWAPEIWQKLLHKFRNQIMKISFRYFEKYL